MSIRDLTGDFICCNQYSIPNLLAEFAQECSTADKLIR